MNLDAIDKKLINTLQKNSKTTTKQLSQLLNLSATAIYERVKKLKKNNTITNYIALVNRDKVDRTFLVLIQVKLVQHQSKYIKKFETEVLEFSEVLECFNISGDYDYQLKIVVKNMKAYRKFLNEKLTTLDYIGSTYSTFVINEVKNSTLIIL